MLALEPEALVVAFGLEVAGEDDVAVAMGWALDAAAMARRSATPATPGRRVLRIGARTNVASIDDAPSGAAKIPRRRDRRSARARARGDAGSAVVRRRRGPRDERPLHAARGAAPQRIARRSRVIEVVGPRRFEERDRARLERRGKFVGRSAAARRARCSWFDRAIADESPATRADRRRGRHGQEPLVAELIARTRGTARARVTVTDGGEPGDAALAVRAADRSLPGLARHRAGARARGARAGSCSACMHLLRENGIPDERARDVVTDLDRAMELRDGVGVGAPEVADLRPRIAAGLAVFRAAMTDRQRPLLTVIEDVHLADGASLEVLRHTLAVPAAGPRAAGADRAARGRGAAGGRRGARGRRSRRRASCAR